MVTPRDVVTRGSHLISAVPCRRLSRVFIPFVSLVRRVDICANVKLTCVDISAHIGENTYIMSGSAPFRHLQRDPCADVCALAMKTETLPMKTKKEV